MRILYLHQHFKHPGQSGGTRSYDLARSFVQKGFTVDILCATSDVRYHNKNSRWVVVELNGLRIHYVYLPYSSHMSNQKRIWVFLRFLWLCTAKCLKLECDVVLATSTPLTIGIPALIKRLVHKVPYIFEVRDVWPEAVAAIGAIQSRWLLLFLEGVEWVVYKHAKAIVPLSWDMRDSICSRFPEFNEKSSIVIENISEIQRFRPDLVTNNRFIRDLIGREVRFVVLYAGAFGRVNGLDYLIQLAALTLYEDSEIVYVAVGDGVEKNRLISIANEKDVLNRNLFFMDSVAKEMLPLLYAEANMGSSFVINVKPLWANSANKFFDTLAAGKPILINHGGWQSDVITKEECGFVLPSVLSKESAKEFVKYTMADGVILRHGENALKLASEEYALDVAVQSYVKVFDSVLSK